MKDHTKWLLISLITSFLLISMATNTIFAQTYATETNIVEEAMDPTETISGAFTDSSFQVPSSNYTTLTPNKSIGADLSNYESKVNVSILTNPERVQLSPNLTLKQSVSYSKLKLYTAGGYIAYTDFSAGTYTQTWTKTTGWSLGFYSLYSYGRWLGITPFQPMHLYWEMNMTIPWSWDFNLNIQWAVLIANVTVGATPPYFVSPARIQIYNWQTTNWDILKNNVIGQVARDDFFVINRTKYVNPLSQNITVQVGFNEGQNSTASHSSLWIEYAGAFTTEGAYLSHTTSGNFTGSYLSSEITLDNEEAYFYDNFTLDIANVSRRENYDQFQINGGQVWSWGFLGMLSVGQSFVPQHQISNRVKIAVQMVKTGNPLDSVVMTLYKAANGLPIGLPLASLNLPAVLMSGIFTWYNFSLTLASPLINEQQYCFVLNRTGPPDAVNFYRNAYANFNLYGPGILFYDGGAGYWPEWNQDLNFQIYYNISAQLEFGYRHSANGVTWSAWIFTPLGPYANFTRHNVTVNVHQNLSRYLQFQLRFYSNDLGYCPIGYNVTLFWISYEQINYTILEFDQFSYSHKVNTIETVKQINISITITTPLTPQVGWIRIYDVVGKHWDLLHSGLNGGDWILKGSNLTTYYNNSVYLLFWYFNAIDPIIVEKQKDITFFWDYYYYEEIDILTFNVTKPEFIYLNTDYTIPLGSLIGSNISFYNISNSVWITIPLMDYVNYTIPLYCYNTSIILRTIIVVSSGIPLKSIEVTVFYYPPAPSDIWTWLTPTLLGIGIGAIAGTLVYYGYWKQRHTGATIISFH